MRPLIGFVVCTCAVLFAVAAAAGPRGQRDAGVRQMGIKSLLSPDGGGQYDGGWDQAIGDSFDATSTGGTTTGIGTMPKKKSKRSK